MQLYNYLFSLPRLHLIPLPHLSLLRRNFYSARSLPFIFRCLDLVMLSLARIRARPGLVFYVFLVLLAFAIFYIPFSRLSSSYYHLPSISRPSSHSSPTVHFPSLRHVCDTTDWTEGLWLHCHNRAGPSKTSIKGGLSNARNRIQTCLRLAISAGAGVIVIPPLSSSLFPRPLC